MISPQLQHLFSLAMQRQQSGRPGESEALLRQILSNDSRYAPALHQLGLLAFRSGHPEPAIELIRRAIASEPQNPAYPGDLGFIYKSIGRLQDTIACFRAAAELRPDLAEAHFNLGAALEESRQWDAAIAAYRSAVERKPNFPEALNNLASVLDNIGRPDEAIAAARAGLELRPGFPQALKTLASALAKKGDLDQALMLCRQVIASYPDDAAAHFQAGSLLLELRQPHEATAEFRSALALRPTFVPAMWDLAFALLMCGNLREGFAAYEARHAHDLDFFHHAFTQPMWDGSDLAGRRILIHPEKGNFFGEVIQFARYIQLVAARGGRVILECQPELKKLLATLPGAEHVVALGDPLPPFDAHCPLMSLPARFETTLETVPWSGPYVSADPLKMKYWRERLSRDSSLLKVGLAWSGRPLPAGRAIEPECLAPLGAVAGVQFYSLQKPPTGAERTRLNPIDCGTDLHDFSDTAALLMNLDLVITIDTAVAHLAGALGRPTWLLLRRAADWRWLLERQDSPWYPSMSLFRQARAGDWTQVIADVAAELARRAGPHVELKHK